MPGSTATRPGTASSATCARRRACAAGRAARRSRRDPRLPALRSPTSRRDGGRAVVLYDQLGNGSSTHLPERGADFWTVELFVRELANLIDHLGIGDRYHVLGQSWGGFLAQEHALTQPRGLRSLVLSNTAASFPDFVARGERACAPTCRRRSRRRCAGTRTAAPPTTRSTPRPAWSSTSATSAGSSRGRRASPRVREDRRGPDRLPHDERAVRVPRHRHHPRLAVGGPPRRDRRADARDQRRVTTRRRRPCRSRSSTASARHGSR